MSQKRKSMLSLWFALSIPLLTSALPTAWAEDGALVEEVVVPEFVPTYSATLKQLGANYPMNLRGIEGSDSVSFGVRADQVVTKARVNLEYSYSPSMLSDLSQINVMVNDQVAASLPVPKETAGTLQQQVVDWRRDFHAHPELSNREERTAAKVAERLRAMGLNPKTGVAVHGVVAIIKGGKLIRSGTMEEVKGDDSLEEVFLELEGESC